MTGAPTCRSPKRCSVRVIALAPARRSGQSALVTKAGSSDQLVRVEAELNVRFPDDYRAFITASDGVERNFGGSRLVLYGLDEIADLNNAYELSESYPGLILIGTDGGGEAVGFDFRQATPLVVLVNFVSAGWDEAIPQAATFTDFMAQREAGEEYRFAP